MIRLPGYPGVQFSALLVLVAASSAQHAALVQGGAQSSPPSVDSKPEAGAQSTGAKVWTCPMHPQVRQAKPGKCPVCAMELTAASGKAPDQPADLMGLQEMLAIALEHNPDVRAAHARLQATQAELDRTRFDVLQQIIAFRNEWGTQSAHLNATLHELQQAQFAAENADAANRPRAEKLADTARQQYLRRRAMLDEVEAKLPFLLGQTPGQSLPPSDRSRQFTRDQLLPKARQLFQLRLGDYEIGNASIADVIAAHRQLTDFETRMAETTAQKLAALQDQKKLLQHIRAISDAQYRAGKANQGDVVAVDLELSKMDLTVLELEGQ
jgi:outer membrane protein TolC